MAGGMTTPIPRQVPRANPYPTSKPKQLRHGEKSVVPKVNANPIRPRVSVPKSPLGKGMMINVKA
jgi:hypothetical protein